MSAFLETVRADPCAYCGGPAEHLDHIVPKVRGGEDGWQNRTDWDVDQLAATMADILREDDEA